MTNANKRLEELGFYLAEWSVNHCRYHKFFEDGRRHNVELMLMPGDECSLMAYSTEDEPVGLNEAELAAFLPAMVEFKKFGLQHYKEEASMETLGKMGFEMTLGTKSLRRFRKMDEDTGVHVGVKTSPSGEFQLLSYTEDGRYAAGLSKEQLKAFLALMEVFEEVKNND